MNIFQKRIVVVVGWMLISSFCLSAIASPDRRPNVLLIVVDDMGFTDLGSFGGEIDTPNLDKLAYEGVRLTSFYSAPTCSPTRAMLLSGTDNHLAGLGNMAEEMASNQRGQPGYEGYLNYRVAALPELLWDAGYHTYMSGKWHLGLTREVGPAARGFERSFAMLQGGAGHFDRLPLVGPRKAIYRDNGYQVESLPENFYSTRFYTDKLMEYIEENRDDGRPFFGYLAYTAPHWPLQAPAESIEKYQGKYRDGYEQLAEQRLARARELGVAPEGGSVAPMASAAVSWEQLNQEQRQYSQRLMEIYAAMIDDVDKQAGRLLAYLESIDELDNTFIIFMSDNGAEGHDLADSWDVVRRWVAECCDNSFDNMGKRDSYLWHGPEWAHAVSTPFRLYKGFTSEGGIRVPAFIHYAGLKRKNVIETTPVSVMDVVPTVLDLLNLKHPAPLYKGREIHAIQGHSLLPLLRREKLGGENHLVSNDNDYLGWELFGKKGLRMGNWKLVRMPAPYGNDQWQLYNLKDDPAEQDDLAKKNPKILQNMLSAWRQYEKTNNVIAPSETSGY